jgi:hypothetical protein
MNEYVVPEQIKSLNWCEDKLLVGFSKKYIYLGSKSGEIQNIFSTGSINSSSTLSLCISSQESIVSRESKKKKK